MTPEGWREVGLTDVAHLEMGETLIAKDLSGDGIPVFSAGRDPAPWGYTRLSKKVFGRGTIILGARGTIGYPRLPRFDRFVSTQTTIAVTPFTSILPDFLKCALNRVSFDEITAKQAIPMLTISALRELRFIVPQLSEQRKIAAILSAVDDAIEGTQAVLDQLQVVKKAMMAELLMRGLRGRHTRFKRTALGDVPESWRVVGIGDVATIGTGSTPSRQRSDYWDGGTVPWLPTGKVNDRIIRTAEQFVTRLALEECPIRLLSPGTVLVAMIGQGKTRGMVAHLSIEATINQNFAYVSPSEHMRSMFLFGYLEHKYEELRNSARGSNQGALNCSIIRSFPVPVPPIDEQLEIESALCLIESRVDAEQRSHHALVGVKSALMSVLLTGEIRVTPDEATP